MKFSTGVSGIGGHIYRPFYQVPKEGRRKLEKNGFHVMKKRREIFVLHHSFPESEEAQKEANKYRSQGYDVFVFNSCKPRGFDQWTIASMLTEMIRLEHFTRACNELRFSGQAVLHAKIELDTLRCILQDFIPRRPFADLPVRTINSVAGIQNFVTKTEQ